MCATLACAVQRPQDVGILPQTVDHHLKWAHSIVQEPDYCSEWVAAHRATELALQCGTSTCQLPSVHVNDRSKDVGCLSVRFRPLVDVLMGNDDLINMHSISVPAEVLPHIAKPWSSDHQSRGVNRTLPSFDFDRDVGCPIDQLFTHFVADGDGLTLGVPCPDVDSFFLGRRTEGWDYVPSSPNCEISLEKDAISHAVKEKAEELPTGHKHRSDRVQLFGRRRQSYLDSDHAQFLHSFIVSSSQFYLELLWVDPRGPCLRLPSALDLAPVSNSEAMSNSSECTHSPVPRIFQSLREDYVTCSGSEAFADEGSSGALQPRSEASGTVPSRAVSPIRLPPFAQQMMVNLPLEFLTNPVRIVQGFVVRTWYLHHINIPLSLQARQIMMTGPPHLWRAQILTTWADLLIPGEDLTLDLVSPNPPRNWHEARILFDLILAQGMHSGRFSGLVTVSPTITEPILRMYAVAVSFEPVISGQDLVTCAGGLGFRV